MTATILLFPRVPAGGLFAQVRDSFAVRREMLRQGYSGDHIDKEVALLESLSREQREFVLDCVLPNR